MWTKEQLLLISKRTDVLVGVASVVSGGAGLIAGYLVAEKRLKMRYEELAKQEIEEAKLFYRRVNKTDENGRTLSPQEVLESSLTEEALEAFRSYRGEETAPQEEKIEGRVIEQKVSLHSVSIDKEVGPHGGKLELVENVFASDRGDVWDYEKELAIRAENPDRPYIISHDEFFEGEKEYEQANLTYFEGDDVLSDDKDVPVPDPEATVGEDNLLRFGYGSEDKNVVYVRNDHLELDFEILRSSGRYSKDVLGFDDSDELQHSERRGVRKFRGHDD